jgi:uncharacterized protein (DUF2132 family)
LSPDPLHGLTLETILNRLVERLGWSVMAQAVDIRCFKNDPSVKSSLAFLRKTPWAREKVEKLYIKKLGGPKSPFTAKAPGKSAKQIAPPLDRPS